MEIKSAVSNCPKKREKTSVDRLLKRGILNKSLQQKADGCSYWQTIYILLFTSFVLSMQVTEKRATCQT